MSQGYELALLNSLIGLDSETLRAIIASCQREGAALGDEPDMQAWRTIYGLIASAAEVALVRKTTGVPV